MRFVAIDVETACSAVDSICQIGICIFQDGREVGEFETLINPERRFDRANIGVHGITEQDVADAPTFASVMGAVNACLRGSIVVSHSHFDRNAMAGAYGRLGRALPDCTWIDSIALAEAAWPEQAERGGYKLSLLARRLGIEFRHHDALDDARTAGRIALAAMTESRITLEQAVRSHGRRVGGQVVVPKPARRRVDFTASPAISVRRFPGGSGPLSGQRIAFTGTLSLARDDAARLACSFGAECADSVSRRTTLLVIGDPSSAVGPGGKSGKQIKVEKLIAEGASIRILSEAMFMALCNDCHAAR